MSQDYSPSKNWTTRELLDWTEDYFRQRDLPSARLDAELLLARALGVDRLGLLTKEFEQVVDEEARAVFRDFVKRRGLKEPVAYLTGEKEFYSLPFKVTPAVLTPRPETEHLVDEALAIAPDATRILDLGTGSGNIAVALAVNLPGARVTAVDISPQALELARENAELNNVAARIDFIPGDLCAALEPGTPPFDLVVSNPPYIAGAEEETLMDDVRLFEPRIALIDSRSPESDGLGFYRVILDEVAGRLVENGALIVEVGEKQGAKVVKMFEGAGFTKTSITRDYAKVPRIISGHRQKSF